MTLLVFSAALASALLHATWNALARARPDPGFGLASIVVAAGFLALPLLIWTGLPDAESWKYIAYGGAFNMVGMRLTMEAYRRLPFTLAYPLSRGSIPLAVMALDIAVVGHGMPSALVLGGVGVVSLAIFLLAKTARPGEQLDARGLVFTLGAGLAIASVIVCDSVGVRLAGDTIAYGSLVAVVNAILMPIVLMFEGVSPKKLLSGNKRFGLFAAFFSMVSYLLILMAFKYGPIAAVAAIRETSVLFGTLFATLMLGEKPGIRRIGAIGLAFCGMAFIRLG